MSKKIKITFPNKDKLDLYSLFHKYLCRKASERIDSYNYEDDYDILEYWDRMFPGWDENFDNDEDVVFPPREVKKGKDSAYDAFWQSQREERWNKSSNGKRKHTKSKKHKAKLLDIKTPFDGEEEDYNFDSISLMDTDDEDIKEIWFYPDYHCKEDRLLFNNLKEFSDYCENMGFYVDNDILSSLTWRYESHCCLNPRSEKLGILEIMCDNSYGGMFYEASDEINF